MKFDFSNMTYEAATAEYKKLARIHHPDFGGILENMQQLNEDYSRYAANYAKSSAYSRQQEAHANGKKSAADYHDMDDLERQIYETINEILNKCSGIDLELCGLWIWVTGQTKENKDTLKDAGFKWAPKKLAWYKAFVPSFSHGAYSLDQIRTTYGSQKFEKQYSNSSRQDDKDERQPRTQPALIR